MIRTRFAPSPTGYLHLGNIRTALFNYLFAKQQGGRFILRIEDTDRERSREEFYEACLEDLLWMGIRWDEGPDRGGEYGPYRQSERMEIYQQCITRLIKEGKAYYCYVTEAEIEEMKRLARLERRPPRFDNRSRYFSQAEIERRRRAGIRPTVRFKIENPQLEIEDLIRGTVRFNLDDMMGDFVIQRADGVPTFHLAVTVDDALMQVTHVIRGEDHLSNTPKHILLFQALGFSPPRYGHLSLVHGPGGEPLSKRQEAVSVREFRRRGYLPHALANYISLLGWSPGDNREIFSWEELQQAFRLERVGKSASIFDPHKLDWINGEHLRHLSDEEFSRIGLAYLKGIGRLHADEEIVTKVLPIFKDNIVRLEELDERLSFLAETFPYENPQWIRDAKGRRVLQAALESVEEFMIAPVSPSTKEKQTEGERISYEAFVERIKIKVNSKGKDLFMPLRVALTGKEHGPELKRLFPVLGLEAIKKRLRRALES